MADGLLIIDKPAGPTSHDVVARVRRALREPRIGHTGTLDPMATGVLLLVVGKATRLAKFLSASDKGYDATVRFGFATDTADAEGRPLGPRRDGAMPSREAIDAALDAFRGTFLQQPPAFSAKKIDGTRSYKLARDARAAESARARADVAPRTSDIAPQDSAHSAPLDSAGPAPRTSRAAALDSRDSAPRVISPAPCRVTAHAIRIVSLDRDQVTLTVDCSAGFYIRSLAHDLGERLAVGAHLTALRRTRVGDFGIDRAVPLDAFEHDPQAAAAALVPLAAMLNALPSLVLTPGGAARVSHGLDIRPIDHEPSAIGHEPSAIAHEPSAIVHEPSAISHQPFVRLLDAAGNLVAVAEPAGVGGALHPSVVLV